MPRTILSRVPRLIVVLLSLAVVAQAEDPRERLRDPFLVTGSSFRNLFREVITEAHHWTVQIRGKDGKAVALGTILTSNGEILTKASELDDPMTVELSNGRQYPATLMARAEAEDLALIKISASNLRPVRWSAAQKLMDGQWLVTPGTAAAPVAVGVLSVQPRKIPDAGIHGVLGIELERTGVAQIRRVFEDGGAASAGMQPGDVILELNRQLMETGSSVISTVRKFRPGETISVKVMRGEEELELAVTLTHPFGDFLSRIAMQNQLGGELSGRRDNFPSALQHDTVLRPRDCGGSLIDLNGEAVAVNIARAGRTESYAIPAADVQAVVTRLRAEAKSAK